MDGGGPLLRWVGGMGGREGCPAQDGHERHAASTTGRTDLSDARCEGVTWTRGTGAERGTNVGGSVKLALMRSSSANRAVRRVRRVVALQPVIDLIDRVDLGYEAQPPPAEASPRAVITAALALAQHTGPAVLLVPLHRDVLTADDFGLAALAQRHGVNPGELARVVQTETDLDDCGI